MEKDFLKPNDRVEITIQGPQENNLYQTIGTGYHSLEEAVRLAVADASPNINPEDCVFVVSNKTTNVAHRYRLNAHGNLKLIV